MNKTLEAIARGYLFFLFFCGNGGGNYYVYMYLRENGTPYYIGKGKGNRAYSRSHRAILPPNDITKIEMLAQNLTEEQAFSIEIFFIALYGRLDINTGTLENRTDGGEGSSGRYCSEETIAKMSEKAMGNKHSLGRKHTNESKAKMSEKALGRKHFLGRKHTNESKAKMSEKALGRKHSKETKAKISEKALGKNLGNKNACRKHSKETKVGYCVVTELPV